MSKLDKFFKAKDTKKEKELQKNAPKPASQEDAEDKKIVYGEFDVASDITGRTLTLTKAGVTIEEGYSFAPQHVATKQWKQDDRTVSPPPAVEQPAPKEEKKPETWRAGGSRARRAEVKMAPEDFPSLADAAKIKDTKEVRDKAGEAEKEKPTNVFRAASGPRSAPSGPGPSSAPMFASRSSDRDREKDSGLSSGAWRRT